MTGVDGDDLTMWATKRVAGSGSAAADASGPRRDLPALVRLDGHFGNVKMNAPAFLIRGIFGAHVVHRRGLGPSFAASAPHQQQRQDPPYVPFSMHRASTPRSAGVFEGLRFWKITKSA